MFDLYNAEMMAAITDLWIAGVALYAFVQFKKSGTDTLAKKYYAWHFLLMALATTFGGLAGHAFSEILSTAWKLPGWLLSMLSVTLLERAIIEQSKSVMNLKWIKALLVLNMAELFVFSGLVIYTQNFHFVEYHAAYGLLFVILGVGLLQLKHLKLAVLKWLFTGVLFGIISATVFTLKIGVNTSFDHVSVSHMLLSISVFCFYKQGIK
jgi:hypothetical protein